MSIQIIRGTTEALNASQNIFLDGQPIYEKTPNGKPRFKIGDGVNTYANLPYLDDFIDITTGDISIKANDTSGVKLSCTINSTSTGDFPVLDISGYSSTSADSNIQVSGVANPTDSFQVANKRYVDACIPIGGIIAWSGVGTPANYLKCDGSIVSINTYPELYKVCGATYGTASSGLFKLPDLRNRFIMGYNASNQNQGYKLGDQAGTLDHSHTYGVEILPYFGALTGYDESMIKLFDANTGWGGTVNPTTTVGTLANSALADSGKEIGASQIRIIAETAPQNNIPQYTILSYVIRCY